MVNKITRQSAHKDPFRGFHVCRFLIPELIIGQILLRLKYRSKILPRLRDSKSFDPNFAIAEIRPPSLLAVVMLFC